MSIPAWLFDLAADLVADRETLVGVLAEWNVDPPDLAAVALTIGSTDPPPADAIVWDLEPRDDDVLTPDECARADQYRRWYPWLS